MTLNETWKNCLAMWKWIAEQIRGGSKLSVEELKEKWLKEHGFENIEENCFFCDYDLGYDDDCMQCPARLVDPDFHCDRVEYNWEAEPIKFYEKLVALDKERTKDD